MTVLSTGDIVKLKMVKFIMSMRVLSMYVDYSAKSWKKCSILIERLSLTRFVFQEIINKPHILWEIIRIFFNSANVFKATFGHLAMTVKKTALLAGHQNGQWKRSVAPSGFKSWRQIG